MSNLTYFKRLGLPLIPTRLPFSLHMLLASFFPTPPLDSKLHSPNHILDLTNSTSGDDWPLCSGPPIALQQGSHGAAFQTAASALNSAFSDGCACPVLSQSAANMPFLEVPAGQKAAFTSHTGQLASAAMRNRDRTEL